MDFYNRFKSFIGLPPKAPDENSPERPGSSNISPHNRNNEHNNFDDQFEGYMGRNFNIFSDPVQMHKYFEQQLSEMLRNFGFHEFSDDNTFSFPGFPQIEDGQEHNTQRSGELRDQFLKPMFENENGLKKDQDIDGNKLDMRDLDSILDGQPASPQLSQKPRSFFFGSSISSKTITNGDTVEFHKTVRDNEGNEETTITRRKGDQEYTVIKRRDKNGKEEIIENMVNLDDSSPLKTLPMPDQPSGSHSPQNWSLFDKFFK